MGLYDGKVALITGSRRGVGKLIAEHFLIEGASVVGLAKKESTIEHARYRHFQIDLSDTAAIQKLFKQLRKEAFLIDVLINNAAVLTSQHAMIMPLSAAQAMVNVNLLAPFLISREAAKMMQKNKWGRIINISSMAASLEPVGDSIYAACKNGITTLANVMAKEFASFNITCNTLAISAIESDMLQQLPRDKVETLIASLPLPRFACADDILNVIDFFSAERSSYVTAQTIYLGGIH